LQRRAERIPGIKKAPPGKAPAAQAARRMRAEGGR
jgi:hypothetical protein